MNDRLCNRAACRKPGADWWNPSTRAYYCRECAYKINEHNTNLCFLPPLIIWSDVDEAAKWPEGVTVLSFNPSNQVYAVDSYWRPDIAVRYASDRKFARLA